MSTRFLSFLLMNYKNIVKINHWRFMSLVRGMKLQEALELTAKVLVKTMDTASPTAERLEFGIAPWDRQSLFWDFMGFEVWEVWGSELLKQKVAHPKIDQNRGEPSGLSLRFIARFAVICPVSCVALAVATGAPFVSNWSTACRSWPNQGLQDARGSSEVPHAERYRDQQTDGWCHSQGRRRGDCFHVKTRCESPYRWAEQGLSNLGPIRRDWTGEFQRQPCEKKEFSRT